MIGDWQFTINFDVVLAPLAWAVLPSVAHHRKRTCMIYIDVRNTRDGMDVVVVHAALKRAKVHTFQADKLLSVDFDDMNFSRKVI